LHSGYYPRPKKQASNDIISTMIEEIPQAEHENADVTDTSLTLAEAIKKYHSPDENTRYSVTLWGGAHFEGERACMNERCVNSGTKIPVGKLHFWRNDFGDGSWFFFCSIECKTEVYTSWYAKAHPPGAPDGRRERMYSKKTCETCHKQFTPTGGAQKYCPDCKAIKHEAKANPLPSFV
jgi:hypothetical protein